MKQSCDYFCDVTFLFLVILFICKYLPCSILVIQLVRGSTCDKWDNHFLNLPFITWKYRLFVNLLETFRNFVNLKELISYENNLCLKAAVSFPLIDVFGNMRINAKHKLWYSCNKINKPETNCSGFIT